MVKIKLQRHGAKKNPQYLIVAANVRSARNGQYIEKIGFYFPKAVKAADKVLLDQTKLDKWIANGAQMTQTVSQVVTYVGSKT